MSLRLLTLDVIQISKESRTWLSENVLVGWTSKRGNAWHWQEGDNNHYEEAIPLEDVQSRLLNWMPEQSPVYIENGEDFIAIPDKVAVKRSDNGKVLGIFNEGYPETNYQERVITPLQSILDDSELSIGSAGLLKEGAIFWLQIETPDNITTPEGVEFRPYILAASSLDGSLSNTFKKTVTLVVCDNTASMALREKGQEYKVKNTRNSSLKLAKARDALNIIFNAADEFSAQVKELCETSVSDSQWTAFVEEITKPVKEDSKAAVTKSERKRETLTQLYKSDERCAPWQKTAYGVVQTMNTYGQHVARVNSGTDRFEKNKLNALKGHIDESDKTTLTTLNKILAAA